MSIPRSGLAYAMLLMFGLSASAEAAEEKPGARERLEAILKERATIKGVYSWDYELVPLKGKKPDFKRFKGPGAALEAMHGNGLDSFVETPTLGGKGFTRGRALFDCNDGRFFLRADAVTKWINGAAPSAGKRARWGFDGVTYSMFTNSQNGPNLPPEGDPSDVTHARTVGSREGSLSATLPSADSYRAYFSCSGGPFLPPYIGFVGKEPLPTRMEEFVETLISNNELSGIDESDDGVMKISFEYSKSNPQSTVPDRIEFTLDQRRGGMLTRVAKFPAGLKQPIDEYRIEPAEWADGVWGPAQVTYVNWLNGFGSRTQLTNRKIRHDVTTDEFRVEMPFGTMVNDHIKELFYIASNEPVDEAKAKQGYVGYHSYRPEPNAAAVPVPKAMSRPLFLLIAVIIAVLAGLGLLAIRRLRRVP